jgi:hypothetical protein
LPDTGTAFLLGKKAVWSFAVIGVPACTAQLFYHEGYESPSLKVVL